MQPSHLFLMLKTTITPAFVLLLLSTAIPGIPKIAEGQPLVTAVLAQTASPESFPLPASVPSGTTVKVDGSSSMSVINQSLKERFEQQYGGTSVELAETGTDAALQKLLNGEIDLAAIGRPLTVAERQQGLTEVPLSREKIAIIIGPDNPFNGSLTFAQFAQIFRGEITNWSQVGGAPGPIRFVDRPNISDTRVALSNYQVFKTAPFTTGATATQIAEDDTAAIIGELGKDGISYAIASQVLDQNNVKVVLMHNTLPSDPRYPFSQSRGFVYNEAAKPAAALAFLGFATSDAGQQAVQSAKAEEAEAVAAAETSPTAAASPDGVASPGGAASPDGAVASQAAESAVPDKAAADATGTLADATSGDAGAINGNPNRDDAFPLWLLWLLPLALLGLLVWGWLRRKSPTTTEAAPPLTGAGGGAGVPPATTLPVGDSSSIVPPIPEASPAQAPLAEAELPSEPVEPSPPTLAERAGSVISSDRTTLAGNRPSLGDAALVGGALAGAAGLAAANSGSSMIPPAVTELTEGLKAQYSGDLEGGLQRFGRSVEYDPNLGQGWWAKGNALLRLNQPAEALSDFDRAIALSPNTAPLDLTKLAGLGVLAGGALLGAKAWRGRGDALVALNQPEAAIASFDQAIELDVNDADAYIDKGYVLLSQNNPGVALTCFDRAVQLHPRSVDAWIGRGRALAMLGHYEEALHCYNQATELDANSFLAWQGRSKTLEALGHTDEAHASFLRASELQPSEQRFEVKQARDLAFLLGTGATAWTLVGDRTQTDVEATKYDVGQSDLSAEALASVDEGLPGLPDGYGESQIVLLPRDPQWAYTYWDVPAEHREEVRRQGGTRLALRFYDVTDIDLSYQNPHNLQQYDCDEMARDWYIPVPVSDRDYIAEIGYVTPDGRWLLLARSKPAHIPPVYPSDWFEDQFITVNWDDELRGATLLQLIPPAKRSDLENPIYSQLFDLAQSAEAQRIAGSLFGSMQHVPGSHVPGSFVPGSHVAGSHVPGSLSGAFPSFPFPQETVSSFVFPSGIGLWGAPTLSGVGMSGVGMSGMSMSGIGMYMSGYGMSGVGMSGIGFAASMPPIRPRKFWLVADAELIVYGATEPDATVTIGGQPIKLEPDGTFRFHVAFPDGMINYPIMAVAVDGEQHRSIHMEFVRETPERNTNTKDEANDEWLF